MSSPDRGLQLTLGPLQVDVPRTVGYYGGIAAAVALGLLEPPLAVFIAAVPLFNMLTGSAAPQTVRFVGQLLEGAAKPVGSDGEGTVTLRSDPVSPGQRRLSGERPRRAAEAAPAR